MTKIFFVGGVEKSRQYLATHPNAIGLLYQPGDKPQSFKRTVLRSKTFQIPADSIAELEPQRGPPYLGSAALTEQMPRMPDCAERSSAMHAHLPR